MASIDEQITLIVNPVTEAITLKVTPAGSGGGSGGLLFGSGPPDGSLGAVGNGYIDTAKGWIYQKTGVSTWTFRAAASIAQTASAIWGTDGSGNPIAVTNSEGLAGMLSDETGFSTGAKAVFSISPQFTTKIGFTDFNILLKNGDAGAGLYLSNFPIATYESGAATYFYAGGLMQVSESFFSISGILNVSGDLQLGKVITPPGTTGDQTINATSGRVNFDAAETTLVVTNSLVTPDSIIHATVASNDFTMNGVQAVADAGFFTLYPNSPPTAETAVNFTVFN